MRFKAYEDVAWIAAVTIGLSLSGPAEAGRVIDVAPGDDLAAVVQNANTGDVIQLGSGPYAFANPLTFGDSGVTLRGQADGSSQIIFDPAVSRAGQDTAMIDLAGRSRITLEHLHLDGQRRADGATYGVYATGGSQHHISHLHITELVNPGEFGPIGVYFNGSVHDSAIRHSTFSQIGIDHVFGSGIRVHGDSDRNLIELNTIDQTGRGGIFALGNNDDDPTFGQTFLEDLTIRHNVVTNSALAGGADLGIEVQNDIRDAVIEDNLVDRRVSIDNAQRVAVRRNTITQAQNTAVATGAFGLEIVDARDLVATDNQVLGNVHLGLSISGDGDTRHALFANNLIQNATTFGVQIQGRDNADATGVAEDLYFLSNTITGTLGGDAALYDNTGDGVRFNMAFDDITLDQNTLADHNGEDLFLNDTPAGSTVALSGNTTDDTYLEGHGLEFINPPLTQERFTAEVGESITVVFDDLQGNLTHVLWDTGQGAPITSADASVTLTAAWLGDSRRVWVVAWDDAGGADTAVVLIPEPGVVVMAMGGVLLFTLRSSRR